MLISQYIPGFSTKIDRIYMVSLNTVFWIPQNQCYLALGTPFTKVYE